MTIHEGAQLLAALIAGAVLGIIFYGGLWLTVRHTLASAGLGAWLILSFVCRTMIVLAGFYSMFTSGWRQMLACLLGFLLARLMIHWLLRAEPRVSHAP